MKKLRSDRLWSLAALALLALCVLLAGMPAYAQTYSVLYDFGGKSGDQVGPYSQLVQGPDGDVYGVSSGGGAHGKGAFFKVIAPGKIKVLHDFCATDCSDGIGPTGLTLRVDAHFVGATSGGGKYGYGTMFDLTTTGTLTVLYNFTQGSDGAPTSALIVGPDGNFYGIINSIFNGKPGGACGDVLRFSSTGTGGVVTTLHKFNPLTDGCYPIALVVGPDGNLYGIAQNAATSPLTSFFKITTNGKFTMLHNFGADLPTSLILGNDDDFYATEFLSIDDIGRTISKIAPDGTTTLLYSMSSDGSEGSFPLGLVQASDGNFYGIAREGGTGTNRNCSTSGGCGTLFEITPTGDFTVLHDFDFTDGEAPLYPPFQHTKGVFYGTTSEGGIYYNGSICPNLSDCGVLYRLNNNLPPYAALIPYAAKVGMPVEILGQGFTDSTTVSFNGLAATVKVSSGTRLIAYVPSGATNGYVTVTTASGPLSSSQPFIVMP